MTTEITRIVDELTRGHNGDAWHGLPAMQILADVDAYHSGQIAMLKKALAQAATPVE